MKRRFVLLATLFAILTLPVSASVSTGKPEEAGMSAERLGRVREPEELRGPH